MLRRWWAHALVSLSIALGLPLAAIWLLPTPARLGSAWVWLAAFGLICTLALAALKWFHVLVPEPPDPPWLRWLDSDD